MAAFSLSLSAFAASINLSAAEPSFEFHDGDRIVFLGGTFIERLQAFGNLEAQLTAVYPKRSLSFRNLGWSGDNVFGLSRAVFGTQADGFNRLKKDLIEAKPTVILLSYGANEAYAGETGLKRFGGGLKQLLDVLDTTKARIVLITPRRSENMGPPLPNPENYNQSLKLYCDYLQGTAQQRGYAFVDLYDLLHVRSVSDPLPAEPVDQLTGNGIHLSEYGDWRTAPEIVKLLGAPQYDWRIRLDANSAAYDAVGVALSALKSTKSEVSFTAISRVLPVSPLPNHSPQEGQQYAQPRVLQIDGLSPGKYSLQIDGAEVAKANHKEWAAGVQIITGPEFAQAEQLRKTIFDKNVLYFYRYRPQNETYLFLFRKHEQGNNAVEIPQFDPLIEDGEKQISQLRLPQKHLYQIKQIK